MSYKSRSHDFFRRQLTPLVIGFCLAVSLSSCGSDNSTEPSPASRVTIDATTPAPSGALTIPSTYVYQALGGVVLPKDSGLISVKGTINLARGSAFGGLNIYLLSNASGSEYCGQNAPDSPTWRSLREGWATGFNVTGFQIYRLPCTVTGIRAIFHSRDDVHIGPPPQTSEIIAEVTLPASLQISMQR